MDYIVLSLIVFSVGLFGVLVRRNLIVILMSIELMLSGVNIAFISFSKMHAGLDGQVAVILIYVIAACEAAVGLAIIVSLFRMKGRVDIGDWRGLKN